MRPLRALLAALALALACQRAPPEPAAARAADTARAASTAPPPLDAQAARVLAALASRADGSPPPALEQRARPALPLPRGVDVVAVRANGRWTVAALEPDRVTLGLEGAERVLAHWREQGHDATAVELAQVVGTFAYYPRTVFTRRETAPGPPGAPPRPTLAASLVERPGGTGRSLTFSYFVEGDAPGAGLKVAHFNVTLSGMVIDEAPNPALR